MSTCAEVVIARQCGVRCFGLSLITNVCTMDNDDDDDDEDDDVIENGTAVVGSKSNPTESDTGPNHNEVLDVGAKSTQTIYNVIAGLVAEIAPLIRD